ncbi:MAG: hypothetical protein JW841_12160 [Deltaproteobacteria bacterium]|nr:hypothetical protein [Deltaproteobacteria bacterium]
MNGHGSTRLWDYTHRFSLFFDSQYSDRNTKVIFSPDSQYFITIGYPANLWHRDGVLLRTIGGWRFTDAAIAADNSYFVAIVNEYIVAWPLDSSIKPIFAIPY